MENTVEYIESRRLRELEKQAALYGPQTEPSILIEIAELRNRAGRLRPAQAGGFVNTLDFDLVRSTVAAALVRLGVIEANQAENNRKRMLRQFIHDLWMITITIMVFLSLLMTIYSR